MSDTSAREDMKPQVQNQNVTNDINYVDAGD